MRQNIKQNMKQNKTSQDILALTLTQLNTNGSHLLKRVLSLRIAENIKHGTCSTIYDGDTMAGFIRWAWSDNPKEALFEGLLIDDRYRQQGYVEKLWNRFLVECRAKGIDKITSFSQKDDHINQSLHQHLGFSVENTDGSGKMMWKYDLEKEKTKPLKSTSDYSWLKKDTFSKEI
ncbi:MAG: GNAT family N-acetyltransferase [bacterium]|nr:GNAT family N-acetyltransferase [bacterium]